MNEDDSKTNNDFSIASQGTEEQKRLHDIRMVEDEKRRNALYTMLRHRDEQIKREEKRLEKVREKIAEEKIREKLQAKAELHLILKGATGTSLQNKAKAIKRAVENKYAPLHAFQIEGLRMDLNRQLDRTIREIRTQQDRQKQSSRTATQERTEEPKQDKTEEMRQNARDITNGYQPRDDPEPDIDMD